MTQPTDVPCSCENCRRLERVRQLVLRCANPPFSHADDGVVSLWNSEVSRLPCLHENKETPWPTTTPLS